MTIVDFIEKFKKNGGIMKEPEKVKGGYRYTYDFSTVKKSMKDELSKDFMSLEDLKTNK